MDASRQLLSVGIDIGTTTTQLVFSTLTLVDVARSGQIPRINITDREVVYKSAIIFTPLVDFETIDVTPLKQFIEGEYKKANVMPSQVETGAVIITGETAKKKNADEILRAMAGLAGDFVVTVAGPNVESMISGRGSGAAEYSRQHFTTVTNVDIGGGSANSAIFKQGNLAATAAMNYGGRIIELDPKSGAITHITQPGKWISESTGVTLRAGDRPSIEVLTRICDCMADMTVQLVEGTTSPLADKLYLTPPSPLSGRGRVLMLSGGIGRVYYESKPAGSLEEVAAYGDVGPLLAARMRQHAGLQTYTIVPPPETMRATVLGASSQLVTLSGSTIWAERGILPLRNVPVIRPGEVDILSSAQLTAGINAAVQRWDLTVGKDLFALALDISRTLNYTDLLALAQGINEFSRQMDSLTPLIIIIQRDYAQSLGQTLKPLIGSRPLLVIDQVGLEEGDFIDIGSPLLDGRVVPLSVKTLIFYH